MENTEIQKLHPPEVIRESWKLYKENAALFLAASFFIAIPDLLFSIYGDYINASSDHSPFTYLLYFVIFLAYFYLNLRFSIVLYFCVRERYEKRDVSFRSAFKDSHGRFWSYLGRSFLFCLILAVPILGISLPIWRMTYSNNLGFNASMLVIAVFFVIVLIYLGLAYCFVPLTAVIDKGSKSYFSLSKKLVRGDFWRILLVYVILCAVCAVPLAVYMLAFCDGLSLSGTGTYTESIFTNVVSLFLIPLIGSAYVIMYCRLKSAKAPSSGGINAASVVCPVCGIKNPYSAIFCSSCGNRIHEGPYSETRPRYCPFCGKRIGPEANYCAGCGAPVSQGPPE